MAEAIYSLSATLRGARWPRRAEATYSLSSASTQRGLDAWARRSWVPDKQSTVFPQLQSNGTGQTIYSLSAASIERTPATLCSLGRTALGRFVDATLLCLTKSAVQPRPNDTVPLRRCGSVSSNQVRLYCFAQHAVTGRRCVHWMMPQFRTCSA